jgi:hypothetical protein
MDKIRLNDPLIIEELKIAFDAYEEALIANDLTTLNYYFWDHRLTVRFGLSEIQYGAEAIRAYRKAFTPPPTMARHLKNLVITSFDDRFATITVEFFRSGDPVGRQSQSWVKFAEGWKIVSAHVSMMGE